LDKAHPHISKTNLDHETELYETSSVSYSFRKQIKKVKKIAPVVARSSIDLGKTINYFNTLTKLSKVKESRNSFKSD
jgi:hypothetical protein